MSCSILAVGKIKNPDIANLCLHYLKKLNHYISCEMHEIKDSALKDISQKKEEETKRLLAFLKPTDDLILLDEKGKLFTSIQLAQWIDKRRMSAKSMVWVVGGPHGFSDSLRQRANSILSLSPLTLPHELARGLLLEQLYRANTILKGEKYHHE